MAAASWYDNRGEVATGDRGERLLELPQASEALMWPYRVLTVA